MTTECTPGELATRKQLDGDPDGGPGVWLWAGACNHRSVQFLTTNPDLEVYVRPILTDTTFGVELVDQQGRQLTANFWYVGPPASAPEPAVDVEDLLRQIRVLSEDEGSPLAALVHELDVHLTATGDLPEAWTHRDYDDE